MPSMAIVYVYAIDNHGGHPCLVWGPYSRSEYVQASGTRTDVAFSWTRHCNSPNYGSMSEEAC